MAFVVIFCLSCFVFCFLFFFCLGAGLVGGMTCLLESLNEIFSSNICIIMRVSGWMVNSSFESLKGKFLVIYIFWYIYWESEMEDWELVFEKWFVKLQSLWSNYYPRKMSPGWGGPPLKCYENISLCNIIDVSKMRSRVRCWSCHLYSSAISVKFIPLEVGCFYEKQNSPELSN